MAVGTVYYPNVFLCGAEPAGTILIMCRTGVLRVCMAMIMHSLIYVEPTACKTIFT